MYTNVYQMYKHGKSNERRTNYEDRKGGDFVVNIHKKNKFFEKV